MVQMYSIAGQKIGSHYVSRPSELPRHVIASNPSPDVYFDSKFAQPLRFQSLTLS